jgi:hypothetical protein
MALSLSFFSLNLTFSGSVSGEKATDFGVIFYSTHYHSGVQYGGYNYYLDGVDFISGWPSSWNSRTAGDYSVDQVVSIDPAFAVSGDYYRFCVFNGWSSAQEVRYTGSIDLSSPGTGDGNGNGSDGLTLNCDVIPPDLTPTVSPTAQPSVSLAPSQLIERGVFPSSDEPLSPLSFLFELNLTSSAFLCSPPVEAIGNLSRLVTAFSFSPDNEVSWASDLLVTVRLVAVGEAEAEECLIVGGEDVGSEATCPSPTDSYEWPEALQSNRDGVYNATIVLVLSAGGKGSGPALYEVISSPLFPPSLTLLSTTGLPHQWVRL